MGDNISVAGSSFNVSRKTIIPPDRIPGIINGRVTFNITMIGVLPKEYAASSNRGLTCNTEALIDPMLAGINKTIYEKINNHIDCYKGKNKFILKNTNDNATTIPGSPKPI